MASKRGSDDDLEGPSSKMSKLDDGGRHGRIRKKSAKVLEMEEFEEIEKKTFSKKDAKGKTGATPPSVGPKKGKGKAPGAEEAAILASLQGEAASPTFVLAGGAVAQEISPVTPITVKPTPKQAKAKEGQGSVIKLLLSAPAIPTSPSVSTTVLAAKTQAAAVSSPVMPQPSLVPPSTGKRVKVKTEPLIKQEPVVGTNMLLGQDEFSSPVFVKGELMDQQSAHLMLAATSMQGPNDPMLSAAPIAATKSEPGLALSSSDTLNSLKLKLMMSPKDTAPLDTLMTTSAPMVGLFPNPDETDGVTKPSASTGKKKAAPRKKKEKGGKAATAGKSAAEQMPNLAALVATPKAGVSKSAIEHERNISLSDAMDTSLSDASLDMSAIVESTLDMEEETALVIAEGAVTGSGQGKPKKKRATGGGSKKKKAKAAAAAEMEAAGFDPDEMVVSAVPTEVGIEAALTAKVQSAGTLGSKKKLSKKSQELQDLQDKKKKRPSRRAPTAYMLYCNAQRPKVVAESPGIDFAQISRTLGVMWQCLSKKEKMMWRRKSKKLAGKGSTLISTGKTGSKKSSSAAADHSAASTSGGAAAPAAHPPARAPAGGKGHRGHGAGSPAAAGDDTPHSPVKGFGIEPIDIAAHLKLLGESLSIIGNRLQEHKGLIAVQGSLSVLLDSMLCACGPLLALTHQVPGLDGCSEATHARTLDMVAYIMPGL